MRQLLYQFPLSIIVTIAMACAFASCGDKDEIDQPEEEPTEPIVVPPEDVLQAAAPIPPGPQDSGGPTVTIEAPWRDGQFSLLSSDTGSVEFKASPQGDATIGSIALEYSADLGQTWITIPCEPISIADHQACSLRPTDHSITASAASVLRITATDSAGRKGSATSLNQFGIADSWLTYDDQITAILGASCTPCHDRDGANADLFRWGVYSADGLGAGELSGKVAQRTTQADNPMPPVPAAPVPVGQRQLLQFWHWQGAPESAGESQPSLEFVSPATNVELEPGGSVDIAVSLAGTTESTKWSLYYSPIVNATFGGKLILGDNRADQTTINWDTTAIPAGDYYLYATITNGDGLPQTVASPTKITSTTAFAAPAITLTGVAGTGEGTLAIADQVTIPITEATPRSSYSIAVSADSGQTWSDAESCSPASEGCLWNNSQLEEGINYRIRITAKNIFGLETVVTTSADFGLTNTQFNFTDDIEPKFLATCAGSGCHPRAQPGAWDRSEADTLAKAENLFARVNSGSMPKDGTEWSPADKQILRLWLWQAAEGE